MMRSPLLYWALFFLIGCAFILYPHWIYLVPFFGLLLLTKRKGQAFIFVVAGAGYTLFRYPSTVEKEVEGRGIFHVEKIQPVASAFQRSYALKGRFLCFETADKTLYSLPCTVLQKKIPEQGTRFLLEGKFFDQRFKPSKKNLWTPLQAPFSLTRWRFENKQKFRRYFQKTIKNKRVSHFFATLATGDIDDRLLAMEFRKVGLGHILAISGFHFALVAAFFGLFLRFCFPEKIALSLLLGFLGIYYLFLGFTPSILRAFIMIAFYIVGRLLQRNTDVCNLLGAALLIELMKDPFVVKDVGFQLSFLATLGIFLYYQPMKNLIQKMIPERSYEQVQTFSRKDQHGYLLLNAIRNGVSLNLAVHLVTLPVVLAIFHSFPLLSFVYNLFFPPLLGISMLLLPFGLFLPPVGRFNEIFTDFLLQMVANPPELIHFQIFSTNISFPTLISFLSTILLFGLNKREKEVTLLIHTWRS